MGFTINQKPDHPKPDVQPGGLPGLTIRADPAMTGDTIRLVPRYDWATMKPEERDRLIAHHITLPFAAFPFLEKFSTDGRWCSYAERVLVINRRELGRTYAEIVIAMKPDRLHDLSDHEWLLIADIDTRCRALLRAVDVDV